MAVVVVISFATDPDDLAEVVVGTIPTSPPTTVRGRQRSAVEASARDVCRDVFEGDDVTFEDA